MTALREAAQQALAAMEAADVDPHSSDAVYKAIEALRAALADPVSQREKEIEDLRFSLDFHQRRCEALQACQSKMRDPERTIVCDILANGFTLDPAFAGDRYTAPPQRKPLTEEEIQDCFHAARNAKLGASKDNSKHRLSVVEIARAIERAHGIGGQDD